MANQAIRQEINLIDHIVTGTGTVTANELSQMDTTQYSGSPTYWFEAVFNGAASNTGTIKLRDVTGATNVASINGATTTTYGISRVQFTPTAGAREYTLQIVGDGSRTQNVNCARIIILQSESAITQTETQIEIGNTVAALANTSVADLTNPKFWKYTAANWDGTKTFNVEVVWTTSAKNTCTITLCRTSDNAANVTIVSAGSNSTGYTRTRVSFTPVDGETYKIRCLGSTTKSTYSIACAKIIVGQTGVIQVTNTSAGTNGQAIRGAVGAAEAEGQSFTTVGAFTLAAIRVRLQRAGTITDQLYINVSDSISGAALGTSNNVDPSAVATASSGEQVTFYFPSGVSLSATTKYYFRVFRTGARDTTNFMFLTGTLTDTYAGGEPYTEDSGVWVAGIAGDRDFIVYSAEIKKCEPQFLLLNTNDSNATGVQNYLTTWNSGEWNADSGTITYYHAMDSDNASNSIKLRDVTAGADISNGTVTGSGQQVSSALGAFTTGNTLDTWVLNTTGIIAAGRILVVYAFVAAAARRIFVTGG